MTIRLLIVDDHPIITEGMTAWLKDRPNLRVVGTATTGEAAIELAWEHKPDVIIMDYRVPPFTGPELTRHILSRIRTNILILSIHDNMLYVYKSLEAGAKGYILKADVTDEIYRAIETVAQGERFITPKLAHVFQSDVVARYHQRQLKLKTLTEKEIEVLTLMAQGNLRAEVAEKMGIRPERFDQHRASILHKLGLKNNMDIVRFAVEAGLIDLFSPAEV